jgi:hypothetical protein
MQLKRLITALLLVLMVFFIAGWEGCEPTPEAIKKEQNNQGNNYTSLQDKQPAQQMDYSPTRDGLNNWMETWGEEGKISYVYLIASNGQKVGYYVFKGLPVSYCASLTPPDRIESNGGNPDLIMKAPSMDGVYYSGSQCNQYFGYDATTGSYIEFSVGSGLNFFVTEDPLPVQDVEPLGFTTIEEGQQEQNK